MYRNTSAEIRPELQQVVEEAAHADRYFVAPLIYPVMMSQTRTGDYRKVTKTATELLAANLGESTRRAARSAYPEVSRTYDKDSFACVDRGLTEVVDDSDQHDLSRFFDAEAMAAKLTLRNVMLAHEARVADRVMNPALWGSENPKVNYTEALIETLDFPYDLEEAIAKVQKRGEMVNTVVLSRNLWKRVRRTTLLRKYLFGDNGGNKMVTTGLLAEAFSESAQIRFIIAEASYATSKKGQAVTDAKLAYVWGDDYMWVGNVAGGDFSAGGAGRTIVWEQDAPGLFITETYRDEARRSDIVRVRQDTDEKEVNLNCGTLIKTNYA